MTMTHEQNTALRPINRHGRQVVILVLGLFVGAILLMWAWNSVAAELLQAPKATFRHGFSVVAALAACVGVARGIWRWGNNN